MLQVDGFESIVLVDGNCILILDSNQLIQHSVNDPHLKFHVNLIQLNCLTTTKNTILASFHEE